MKVGDKVIRKVDNQKGLIIKVTKRTLTVKLPYSTVKQTFSDSDWDIQNTDFELLVDKEAGEKEVFIHKKTGNSYLLLDRTIAKINGEWWSCVIYQNEQGENFVRLKEDFESSFVPYATSGAIKPSGE